MMAGDADFSGPLIRSVIQGSLEGELAAAISAEKASGSRGRLGYRSGYYPRSLITPGCPASTTSISRILLCSKALEELKHRTHVIRIFPSQESALRLIQVVAVEIHEGFGSDRNH